MMAMVAHNPKAAKRVGIPQKVGKHFTDADKGRKFGEGGIADKLKGYWEDAKQQARDAIEATKNDPSLLLGTGMAKQAADALVGSNARNEHKRGGSVKRKFADGGINIPNAGLYGGRPMMPPMAGNSPMPPGMQGQMAGMPPMARPSFGPNPMVNNPMQRPMVGMNPMGAMPVARQAYKKGGHVKRKFADGGDVAPEVTTTAYKLGPEDSDPGGYADRLVKWQQESGDKLRNAKGFINTLKELPGNVAKTAAATLFYPEARLADKLKGGYRKGGHVKPNELKGKAKETKAIAKEEMKALKRGHAPKEILEHERAEHKAMGYKKGGPMKHTKHMARGGMGAARKPRINPAALAAMMGPPPSAGAGPMAAGPGGPPGMPGAMAHGGTIHHHHAKTSHHHHHHHYAHGGAVKHHDMSESHGERINKKPEVEKMIGGKKRANPDGAEKKGHTKGKVVKMARGGHVGSHHARGGGIESKGKSKYKVC
jgi:hypothetical protein